MLIHYFDMRYINAALTHQWAVNFEPITVYESVGDVHNIFVHSVLFDLAVKEIENETWHLKVETADGFLLISRSKRLICMPFS